MKILNNYQSKNEDNILQIVAYHNNELFLEDYRHNFMRNDTMNVMSVTKAITALLVGIAIDKGYIKSVDDF